MLWDRGRSLPDLCARLGEAVDRLDMEECEKTSQAIAGRLERASEADLTEGAVRLIPALTRVAIGNGDWLARLLAGMIQAGADPLPILDALVERVAGGLEQAARFPDLAATMGGELTAPSTSDEADALLRRTAAAAAAAGIDEDQAGVILQAWFTINDWIPALLLPLQQKRARQALPDRARLTNAVAAMVDHAEDAHWLLGLLLVLDDEELIVVHRSTGAVYQVTCSGIGDNFQLHTLLAATLIGDPAAGLIPGERPHPSWIAAATDGEMAPSLGIRGQFNLVDGAGAWIWNEGRPADIPVVAGSRIVVIDPPPYERTWNVGREYPLMTPEISLDRVLGSDESAGWISRIAPPKRPT